VVVCVGTDHHRCRSLALDRLLRDHGEPRKRATSLNSRTRKHSATTASAHRNSRHNNESTKKPPLLVLRGQRAASVSPSAER
jgi:hypothetical protein